MDIQGLTVLHQLKDASFEADLLPRFPNAYFLETCQRRVWVFAASDLKPFVSLMEGVQQGKSTFGFELFRGTYAYEFLLKVTTGLASKVIGETDVFGQFKESWKKFEIEQSENAKTLSSLIHRLLEDTKEIRANYLQQVGGQSYGTLARRILKEQGLSEQSKVLVVGAGQLAKSIAPLLSEAEVWLVNRSQEALFELHSELCNIPGRRVRAFSADQERDAFLNADAVIFCVPGVDSSLSEAGNVLSSRDALRLSWMNSRSIKPVVIHLGLRTFEAKGWQSLEKFFDLDDIFAIQRVQDEYRRVQIEKATSVCSERARLRGLGGSISLPHGWEDLAIFA